MKIKLFVFMMTLFSSSTGLYADWGPFKIDFGKGGIAIPIENKSIKMESAIITIKTFEFEYSSSYVCEFSFRNITNKAQDVTMGFPFLYFGYTDLKMGDSRKDDGSLVKDFSVTIEGKNSAYTKQDNVSGYDTAYCIDVHFEPGESHSIRNVYGFAENGDSFNGFSGAPGETKNEIDYVLRTGSLWADSIGILKVNVVFEHMPYEIFSFMELGVKGFVQKPIDAKNPNLVTLAFEKSDYEPVEDVKVRFAAKEVKNLCDSYMQQKKYGRLDELIDIFYDFDQKYRGGNPWGFSRYTSNDRFTLFHLTDKTSFRNTLYWTANEIFRTNTQRAVFLYLKAFELVPSNSFGVDPKDLIQKDISVWPIERGDTAPAYYIAYNLACAYSLLKDIESAGAWLRIAIRLNPKLIKSLVTTDTDIENLRSSRELYVDIVNNEPVKIVTPRALCVEEVKVVYNTYKNKHQITDKSQIKKNLIRFEYIPVNYGPYGVIIYYEASGDSHIFVEMRAGRMHGYDILGRAESKVKSGRGSLLMLLEPIPAFGELPSKDWIQNSNLSVVATLEPLDAEGKPKYGYIQTYSYEYFRKK